MALRNRELHARNDDDEESIPKNVRGCWRCPSDQHMLSVITKLCYSAAHATADDWSMCPSATSPRAHDLLGGGGMTKKRLYAWYGIVEFNVPLNTL